ncbi:uncharacterized protein DUF1259 [Melghirimyces profundicolus]|uniref:Uncharacterized protein DUF1259 n=1 Tax=Melghirimyces profundicolus TaxID=1242148 RepID=A0A2T6C4V0_9BACL|nr:DUF1259 domain-containing protein [Melghirimyces profundicolus]PTX63349.1 uncharacterized protein DUF1259 [Melghirimyces profundicolus]
MRWKRGWAFLLVLLLFAVPFQPVQAQKSGDCRRLEQALGYKVEAQEGICRMGLIRKELRVTHQGRMLSPETMELELLANFERVGDAWVVMGEFALMEPEVNPVVDRLRQSGLEVTAIHNHMLFERPRVIYLHFQGEGTPERLAKGVRSAVRATSYGKRGFKRFPKDRLMLPH